jgi:putative membrane protein
MLSDSGPRRLHPATILFGLVEFLKTFALPAVLLMFGYRSSEDAWRIWGLVLILPAAIAAVAQYLTFTYTYYPDELVVRSGVLFKNERHIPYGRIQNIDANQGILHRLLGVYNLTLESGSGAEPEATLNVLPESALDEMRRRVFAGRSAQPSPPTADAPPAEPASEALLNLGLRDLALCGLIRGRGLLLLAAIFGFLSQYGLDDRVVSGATDETTGSEWIVRTVSGMYEGMSFSPGQMLIWVALFALVLLVLRLLSSVQTIVMFYGFRLTRAAEELRLSFGLLTHVKATIPIGRIQTITIGEGALHRLFGVSSVRASTAGGGPALGASGSRYLAPIIGARDVAPLVRVLLPQANLDALSWQPAHPRTFRRLLVRHAGKALPAAAAIVWVGGAWTLPLALLLPALAFAHAKLQARHMGHSLSDGVFAYRSGWYMRQTTITPLHKVQAVGLSESPFDRRHGMARLLVDTAGAHGAPHHLHVPFLDREKAQALSSVIAAGAISPSAAPLPAVESPP